jgi:hypothetical protein
MVVLAPAARAVPGGPEVSAEQDQAAALQSLHGQPLPLPPAGNFGTLNSSGVNSASANQINDPSLDGFQSFQGAPITFVKADQAETSMAAAGKNIVVGYNSSAGAVFSDASGDLSKLLFDGFSVSHDAGKTWKSGFIPAEPGAPPFDFGDPAVAADRAGSFYYASLSWFGIQVSKSTDSGETWTTTNAAPVFYSASNSPDKDWIAVGPDPKVPSRDDIYVTWTQYIGQGSQLWMTRSTDQGQTWSPPQAIYIPVAGGVMSSVVPVSNPVVDASNGRLYVPFLHLSNIDADDIRVLSSSDGGHTFSLLNFNVPGAPDAQALPNVTPGTYSDCGSYRTLTIHQGRATVGAGGLPRYELATRLLTQPAVAAAKGQLFIAYNASTSPSYGAGTGSEIRLLYSPDGGSTWSAPVVVAASSTAEPQHVLPAITIDPSGTRVEVVYYTQQASGRVRVDSAAGKATAGGVSFARPTQLFAPFDLPPTNITVSSNVNFPTFNYTVGEAPCYGLGEYLSATQSTSGPIAAWGGDRQQWKEPPGAIINGVHAQQDAFFGPLG